MKLLKKLTAVFLAAALSLGTLSAAAEASVAAEASAAVEINEGGASLIDISPQTETTIIAGGTSEASAESEEAPSGEPESGVDLTDTDYKPIDISSYTLWDGKTKMTEGTNYYIDSAVKPRKNFSVPKGSKFVVTAGASLVVYKSRSFAVRGNMIVEKGGKVSVSGKFTVYQAAGFELYGSMSGTVSSVISISSEFIVRKTASTVFSGTINVYKTGMYLNYGQTTLTSNANMKLTGEMQTPDDGRFLCRGYFAVSISGKATFAGYFSLTGEVVNSGLFIFESTIRYYKSKAARFAVSKSSRLIDYRYDRPGTSTSPDIDDKPTDTGIKGIDVSYAQGAIDWTKVKASGVEFAMLRASRGAVGTKPIAQDTTFEFNVVEATAAGINVGVYHYLYAKTVSEARKEARFFIKTISPYNITYPVVLDVEEQSQANLGRTKITKIVKAFLEELTDAGYYAMLYSNKAWLTNYLDMTQLSDYEVWLAQWNTVPTYTGDFGMWQYSARGIVSGISGYVDLNLSYKNYSKIIKEGGFNHLT